jgi:tetratricopeptide (TPR) repeat protein
MRYLCFFLLKLLVTWHCHAQLDSLNRIFAAMPDNQEKALQMCNLSFRYHSINPHLSETLGNMALELATRLEDDLAMAKAHHVLGLSFWARDFYAEANGHYLKALAIYEKMDHQKGIANMHLNIGNLHDDLNQYPEAIAHMRKGLKSFLMQKDTVGIIRCYNNLGIVKQHLEEYDSSIIYLQKSLHLRLKINDLAGIAKVYNNIGVSLQKMNRHAEAMVYMKKSRRVLKSVDDLNQLGLVYLSLGTSLLKTNELKRSRQYLDSALTLATQIESNRTLILIYQNYKELEQLQGNFDKAYYFANLEAELEKKIRGEEVERKVELLNLRYENEKKAKELAQKDQHAQKEKFIKRIIVVVAFSLIVVALLVILVLRTRLLRNRAIAALRLARLRDELQTKNQEIAAYTLSSIQKHEILETLRGQIKQLKGEQTPSSGKEIQRLDRLMDETFKVDEEWETFKLTFDQMHDGFFGALKNLYPDLGNAELKLCALVRLNMNLKESAKVLGISPDSVKTARHRLRKKLGLNTEDNLVDFLIEFEQGLLKQEYSAN